jgi:Predicted ATPase (AAA+ superfamily)
MMRSLLKRYIGAAKTLVIDEAQRIENIGLCIKLIVDQIPDVKVIATGSSAFDLANRINEPLTGRKWEYHLYPFSFAEMVNHHGLLEERRLLNYRLIYGYYPEIVNNPGEEEARLKQLVSSYLYKDILTWERIQKPDKMERLVQALAFQVGNEVSFNELGQLTGLDNETTEKYIDLLEKSFIIFRLGSLSRNLRNELKKSRKFYFYDNGLRNAVINQFSPATLRQDIGGLWENFVMSERVKYLTYQEINCNQYFWRTHAQQEVDYVEERNGKMQAYEIKWNVNTKVRFPKKFLDAYPGTETHILTPQNIEEFLL